MIILLENTTGVEKRYSDLGGMRIPANSTYDASNSRTLVDIAESSQLQADLKSGDVVWNNGTENLDFVEAISIVGAVVNKQAPILGNTLDDAIIPAVGFSEPIKNQTTNKTDTLVVSFTPEANTLYDVDVNTRALINTKEKGFQNQMKGLVVNQELVASEVIYREGERGLRVVLTKDGADIKILIRGKNSQTWDWKTQICVSEVK